MTFLTTRLHFTPLQLSDTVALHDLRTSPETMKWSRQKVIDKNHTETENWIRKMTDEPLLNLGTGLLENPGEEGQGKEKDRSKTGLVFAVREIDHVHAMQSSQNQGEGAIPDRIIAIVGIRATESPLTDIPQFEIGYMFVPRAWGRGYASEAVKGVVRWWFSFLQSRGQSGSQGSKGEGQEGNKVKDKDGVYAIVAKGNPASLRVMEKCGFKKINEGFDNDGSGIEIVEFRIGRERV
ncbi:GNAT domain-containing protein [Aspergillus oleicola]